MPWEDFKLSDGHTIPGVAFGTWKLGDGEKAIDFVDQALSVGFAHIDTAQSYENEAEAGDAIRDSGLSRSDVYITTKFSGRDGKTISESIHDSLRKLGVSYVDLYLIHHPRLAVPDIPTAWKQMEAVRDLGLVKSIGVSNFNPEQLEILLASAKVKPAANQIMFNPIVHTDQLATHEFNIKNGIVTEGYSPLLPLTQFPGGPVDKAVTPIATRLNTTKDQVLLAWARQKGVLVVTSSRKKERLEGYLEAGDIELTEADIIDIDLAGALSEPWPKAKRILKRAAALAFLGAAAVGVLTTLGCMSYDVHGWLA